jgi:hypothetical protein
MPERELAVVDFQNGYGGLIRAMRERAAERKVALSGESVAAVSGLPTCYLAKLLSPSPHPMRRIGMISLGPVLGVLALKLLVVPDDQAAARFGPQIEQKNESCSHPPVLTVMGGHGKKQAIPVRLLRRISPLGVAARQRLLSPARRSQIARIAATARWAKVREAESKRAKARAYTRKAAAAKAAA